MARIYLPKNKQEVFNIVPSKEGLIIPLINFGYPSFHVTVFFKEVGANQFSFDVHITDELSNEKVIRQNVIFNPNELEERFNKKKEKLKTIFLYHFKKWEKKKVGSKSFACLDCVREKIMPSTPSLYIKKEAEKFYQTLVDLEVDKNTLSNCPVCNKPKHVTLYNFKKNKNYYRIGNHIIPQKDMDNLINSLYGIFKEELGWLSNFFDPIFKWKKHKPTYTKSL